MRRTALITQSQSRISDTSILSFAVHVEHNVRCSGCGFLRSTGRECSVISPLDMNFAHVDHNKRSVLTDASI
jgi:hypothetical protein